jgi:hypothetical protein
MLLVVADTGAIAYLVEVRNDRVPPVIIRTRCVGVQCA